MIIRIQRVNIRYFPEPDAKAVTYTAARKEKKPMPINQRNTVYALIRQQCANYDRAGGGGCLLLDCPCPQLQSQSLICRYCRDAVLPVDKLLYAEIMGEGGVKTCASCGKPFRAVANKAKYCDGCRRLVRKRQHADRQRKYRAK